MKKKIIVTISVIIGLVLIAVVASALVSGSFQAGPDDSEAGIADKNSTGSDGASAGNDSSGSYTEKAPLMNVEIGSAEGKPGDEISVAVSFKNVPAKGINNCDFKLEYDREMLESVEVVPSNISTNFTSNFSSFANVENGTISFLFLDNTLGKELILNDGTFATIRCKIKQSAKNGDTEIKLKSSGAFSDIDLNKIEAEFSAGTVSIGP